MSVSPPFEFELDGAVLRTDDPILDGREIRTLGRLSPASDYVLVRTDGGIAASIGLEETVRVDDGRPAFRSFESDRTYSLTVDERGWEWGEPGIDARDIRRISSVPEDRELFLNSNHDQVIPDGGRVDLDGRGVEHVRSRRRVPKAIGIIVNGRPREVAPGDIGFEQLVGLAFPTPPVGQQLSFTVSFRKGPQPRPEGSILPGQSVHVVEGMTFHVTATDKS